MLGDAWVYGVTDTCPRHCRNNLSLDVLVWASPLRNKCTHRRNFQVGEQRSVKKTSTENTMAGQSLGKEVQVGRVHDSKELKTARIDLDVYI